MSLTASSITFETRLSQSSSGKTNPSSVTPLPQMPMLWPGMETRVRWFCQAQIPWLETGAKAATSVWAGRSLGEGRACLRLAAAACWQMVCSMGPPGSALWICALTLPSPGAAQ